MGKINFYLSQSVYIRQCAHKLFQGGWYNFSLAGIDTSTFKGHSINEMRNYAKGAKRPAG